MTYKIFCLLLFITVMLLPELKTGAQPRSKAIACPPIIGDKTSGSFKKTKKNGRDYECFRSEADAKMDGYLTPRSLNKFNYSGWWRLKINKVDDSCGKFGPKTDLVLFLQLSQHGDAIFGDFCPGLGLLTGIKNNSSISIFRAEMAIEARGALACADGKVEVTKRLQMDRILQDSPSYVVQLSDIRRCSDISQGALTCTTTLSGIAFPETHEIWPSVEKNTSLLQSACSVALDRCSECHDNLSAPPRNPE